MALYVNTNVSAINGQRKLTNATNALNVSYQRLVSEGSGNRCIVFQPLLLPKVFTMRKLTCQHLQYLKHP